jgi:uncharacterized protein YbjT (DUF2867 family)
VKIAIAGGTGAVGRHVTSAVRAMGHEPVVLTRSTGVDLTGATGLTAALEGVTSVIDVTSIQTRSAAKSKKFFGAVTRNLLAAEVEAGVRHHVALGIVGSDKAPFEYYAGKVEQEHLVESGPVPWTILRATQFHEFAAQIYGQVKVGPFVLIPTMTSQPVAAWQVAERLVALAVGEARGRVPDLAGPEVLRMLAMVRQYLAATGHTARLLQVPLPGGFGKAMRDGTLTPTGRFDTASQTFGAWLREGDLP